jgi:hypothetical protein
MHERYLTYAVGVSILMLVTHPKWIAVPILITATSFLNISLIHAFRGQPMWICVSILSLIALSTIILAMINMKVPKTLMNESKKYIGLIKPLPELIFILMTILILLINCQKYSTPKFSLKDNETFIYKLNLIYNKQSFGDIEIDKSTSKNRLRVGGQSFKYGIGTHADSIIEYEIPSNALSFSFMVGIDDVGKDGGKVQFIIKGDDKEIWRSQIISGGQKAEQAEINVVGIKKLSLIVDSLGNTYRDHSNWINPVIKLKKQL